MARKEKPNSVRLEIPCRITRAKMNMRFYALSKGNFFKVDWRAISFIVILSMGKCGKWPQKNLSAE